MTRLDDIQARLQTATPGPWVSVAATHEDEYYARFVEIGPSSDEEWADGVDAKVLAFATESNADAEFIAHCPDDVGWLLDRVTQLETELDWIAFNAESWHGDNAAKGRSLRKIASVARAALDTEQT